MINQDLVAQAKQGDTVAIAAQIERSLPNQNITVTVTCSESRLQVLLEAKRVPDRQACVQLIRDGLLRLQVSAIESVEIKGRQIGQKRPAWTRSFQLNNPERSDRHFAKFLGNKTNLLLWISSLSFCLGSGWGLSVNPNNAAVLISTFGKSLESLQPLSPDPTATKEETPKLITLKPWQKNNFSDRFNKMSEVAIASSSITIKAVGDIIPGTNYPYNKLPQQKQLLFKAVKPSLQGADLLFGNFESTLTDYPYSAKDTSRGMVFAFRTPPDYAKLLKEQGFDVLSVANNHSMDFAEPGFEDTIKNIESAGMKAVGKKGQILYTTVKNVPIAFIGFSTYDYHNAVQDLAATKALVTEAKKKANIVVVSMHAGAEGTGAMNVENRVETFYGEDRGNLVLFSRTAIDAGADLVIGHGPHVPRALELYKGKMIAYSLGNFLGYRTLSSVAELGYSLILEVKLSSQGDFMSGKIIPVHLDGEGIPKIDQQFRSVGLIRNLTKNDFPKTPLKIDSKGQILKQ